MHAGNGTDPVRATLIAILQQLNRVESMHEGRELDQALGLGDLERILKRFWALDDERAKLPQALGLLVRNGLVTAGSAAPAPKGARTRSPARYRITAEGKQFLIEAVHQTNRIA